MFDVRCWTFIEFIGFVGFIEFIGLKGHKHRAQGAKKIRVFAFHSVFVVHFIRISFKR